MRVLHVIDGLQLGGAEALLYRLVQRPSAVEHEVACLGGRDWYSPRLEQAGVTVHHLGKDSFAAAPAAIAQLRGLIRRREIDVVQTWLYRSNMLGGIAARSSGIPVVWSIHCSSLDPLSRASRVLVRLSGIAARWVPDFMINCSICSAELHDRFGYGASPGTVIPNGYDTAVFSPDEARRADSRAALGLAPETFAIGSITRWIDYKDVPSLLGALDIARQRGVDATCLLIGKDLSVDNAELAASIARFGSGDRVVPLGKREDIADLARAMDLHVLSSTTEAFPNAVAETMASAVPNVATDVGDTALIVGETGWVVPPRHPAALAEAIVAAWQESQRSPAKWQARRTAARKRIVDRFTFERMAEAYEQVWTKVARG